MCIYAYAYMFIYELISNKTISFISLLIQAWGAVWGMWRCLEHTSTPSIFPPSPVDLEGVFLTFTIFPQSSLSSPDHWCRQKWECWYKDFLFLFQKVLAFEQNSVETCNIWSSHLAILQRGWLCPEVLNRRRWSGVSIISALRAMD